MLDEHLPLAIDILSDIVRNPAFSVEDLEREKKVVVEEIKMVEDTPDDLVHELFTQGFWENHALGRPILGTAGNRRVVRRRSAARRISPTPTRARNLIVSAGWQSRARARARARRAESSARSTQAGEPHAEDAPRVVPKTLVRNKELEQSHLCLGVSSYPQKHDDRYSSYVLNTLLGGSMSSRLFQNVREKRGLRVCGVQRSERVSRRGLVHDLRRLLERSGRRSDRSRRRGAARRSSNRRCRTPSCSARRITSRAASC